MSSAHRVRRRLDALEGGWSEASMRSLGERMEMAYDRGLVERVADALVRIGEPRARQKNVFGGRGFLVGKKAFVIVWGEGLLVQARRRTTTRSCGSRGDSVRAGRRAADGDVAGGAGECGGGRPGTGRVGAARAGVIR